MIHDGRSPILEDGFSYFPAFASTSESPELISYLTALSPIWEHRHHDERRARGPKGSGRLTRPVFWLGAWQFACLGYYSEPEHTEERCVASEPIPPILGGILTRLAPHLQDAHPHEDSRIGTIPNSALINYYGRELQGPVPVDYARLRMHRDHEPGPVVMLSVGQPGLLEFIDPATPKTPRLSIWLRHRSVCVLSGPEFKDYLYHRITKVRTGTIPNLLSPIEHFDLRRISISFRHVPLPAITPFHKLSEEPKDKVSDYIKSLAQSSAFFRKELAQERKL